LGKTFNVTFRLGAKQSARRGLLKNMQITALCVEVGHPTQIISGHHTKKKKLLALY